MQGKCRPWVEPVTLECPGVVTSIRLVPLDPTHAADLHAVADRELFLHSMQAPSEWSVRGFESELERVRATPGVVAFAIVLAHGENSGRAIGRTTFMDIRPEHRGLEIGRTCVDPAYRNGGTIAVLWSELAEVLNEGGYRYLMGCASIPMQDGGVQAQAIMQRLRERHLCTEYLRAEPRQPLPRLELPDNLISEMPPLLKAYMRLGAKVCGEPCWDPDFQVADVFILLKRDELCPRYARHFKAAV